MPLCQGCTPVIALWSCPIANMARWKSYGINTLVNRELEGGRYTQAQWRQAAAALDLDYIDHPSSNLAADHADPRLVAFIHPVDEPDGHNSPVSAWSDVYTAIRAVSNKPILGNFNAQLVTFAQKEIPPYDGKRQTPFLPYCDWVGSDWYPKNNNPDRYPISLVGDAMRLLGQWSNGKPQISFVECSYQNVRTGGRSPTTAEMKDIVRLIMSHPQAMGYCFFPQRLSGDYGAGYFSFTFDNTTTDMRTAITEINAEMTPPIAVRTLTHKLYSDNTWEAV